MSGNTVAPLSLLNNLKRLFHVMPVRRRWQLGGLVLLMLAGAVAEMATLGSVVPFLALLAGTDGQQFPIPGTDLKLSLESASVLFVAVALGAAGLRMGVLRLGFRFTFALGADLGVEVYRRTLYQPYSWHVAQNSSEVLAAISKVNYVVFNVINPLLEAVVALAMTVATLSMLMLIDAQSALMAGAAFALLYGVTSLLVRRRLDEHGKIIAASEARRIQAVQEGLGGIRDVLLDGTQKIYLDRFANVDRVMRQSQAAISFLGIAPRFLVEATGMVFIVLLASWLSVREGGLVGAIPILGALALGAQKMLPQMQQVYFSWSWMVGNHEQMSDILEILERPLTIAEEHRLAALAAPRHAGSVKTGTPLIALDAVSFRYGDALPDVLTEIDLHIMRGARIGFVGKTGSGKSTLIDIIMGLLEPTAGTLSVDGEAVAPANRRLWQARIAHVPQSIFLADISIAENIAFGLPREAIDMDRVRHAARTAQAADFIAEMSEGYDTMVGERGIRLSGGQRQRIGIARALYKQVDVLVLDEATSALDEATERAVMDAVAGLHDNLTILMIAHRLSTLEQCDEIIEIGQGRIQRRRRPADGHTAHEGQTA